MAETMTSKLTENLCAWLRAPLGQLEAAFAEQRLGHAWLIAGPSGLGKLNLALVFADRLLRGRIGQAAPPPLDPRDAIEAMQARHSVADHHPDLHWLHPEEDKQSIGVDQVREMLDSLALTGFKGAAKVVIIEPADAMTVAAANALLKSLEEPSLGTYLLLISHQPGRLPSTIRSRCQTLAVRGPRSEGHGPEGEATVGTRGTSAPLVAASRQTPEYSLFIKELDDSLNLISDGRRDPQAVAADWCKRDLGLVLDWLIDRIQQTIRGRAARHDWNRITEQGVPMLHNPFAVLPLRGLFRQLASAEKLRDQIGGGINVELALAVLLLGFHRERGRP